MTEPTIPHVELLANAADSDLLRSAAEAVVQMPMEAHVEGLIGASSRERSDERTSY